MSEVPAPEVTSNVRILPVHTVPKEFGAIQITADNMEELCRLMSAGNIVIYGTSFGVDYYNGEPVQLNIGINGRSISLEAGEWLLMSVNQSPIRVTDEDFKKKYVIEVVDPVV